MHRLRNIRSLGTYRGLHLTKGWVIRYGKGEGGGLQNSRHGRGGGGKSNCTPTKGGCKKIRSHAHAVTDWIYCLEPTGSPRPQATGLPGVPGSKSSQLLHGSDFFILFHHFSKKDDIILTVFHTFLWFCLE